MREAEIQFLRDNTSGKLIAPRTYARAVTFDGGDTLQSKLDKGELNGPVGKSAYQQAVEGGLSATEAEFKSALTKIVDAWGNWEQGLTDEESGDPEIVYARTRPVDWLPLPALEEVRDGEVWLLFQWFPGDSCACQLTMKAVNGGPLTVEAGRYRDGTFTPLEKYNASYSGASTTANIAVPISLDSADFGDLTSRGKVQAVVRLSGPMTSLTFSSEYNCVDMAVKALAMTDLAFTKLAIVYLGIAGLSDVIDSMTFGSCRTLKAIRGSADPFNVVAGCGEIFSGCYSLLALPAGVTFETAAKINGMFQDCYSLRRLPPGISFNSNISFGTNMFRNCYALRSLPAGLTFGQLNGSCSYLFSSCYNVREIPAIDFEMATDIQHAFYNCFQLEELPTYRFPKARSLTDTFGNSGIKAINGLYIPMCTNLLRTFDGCYALEELTFADDMTTWATPYNIDLTNTRLNHAAIVELFKSLPTITTTKTITLTGTPGASQVTAEDIAIAEAKGWRVAGTAASDPGLEGPEIFDDREDWYEGPVL